jgi:agmatine/peptidylarginine deiminase
MAASDYGLATRDFMTVGEMFGVDGALDKGPKQVYTIRSFAEYEKAKYLLMSAGFDFNSREAKETILANLPEEIVAILFIPDGGNLKWFEDHYTKKFPKLIAEKRILFKNFQHGDSAGFWVRDTLPLPVFLEESGEGVFGLIDATGFDLEPDAAVSKALKARRIKINTLFEGGNFVSDRQGTCLYIKNDWEKITKRQLMKYYGCKKVMSLPYYQGVGHIDERVKFISDSTVVTDELSYVDDLKKLGLKVNYLPPINDEYKSYINSLIVNKTIYVPTFGEKTDSEALDTYRGFGFKTVAVDFKNITTAGNGAVHCMTMTYPDHSSEAIKTYLGM